MARSKLVKCTLRGAGEAPSLRFVPYREFFLWKYYMTHHHEMIVEGEEVSVWVDAETYGSAPPPQARPLEPVVRVDLRYWDGRINTARLVQRYFPLEDFDSFRSAFLSHFPDSADSAAGRLARRRVSEVKGYFIHPQPP
ncbi:MAG: hypothetical protein ACE5JI_09395 [Acidobacteriota bacterium]